MKTHFGSYWRYYASGIVAAGVAGLGRAYYVQRHNNPTFIQYGERWARSKGHVYVDQDISDLPKEVDWRKRNIVPTVRSQKQCGACYAIATLGSIESLINIRTGLPLRLSPQEIVDCSVLNNGCHGGTKQEVFDYIKRNGIGLEEDYPYLHEKFPCGVDRRKSRFYIQGYALVPFTGYDEVALMRAVAKQPVVVSIGVGWRFQKYKKGVFKWDPWFSRETHTMLVVGYGSYEGEDVWILQNSYGEGWGINGFMYLQRNSRTITGRCGLLISPAYPIIENLPMVKDKEQEKKDKKKNGCPEKKRPTPAYMLWVKDQWHEVKKENPEAEFKDISNMLGAKWKTVSAEAYLQVITKEKREIEAMKLLEEEQKQKTAMELLEQYMQFKQENKKEKDPLKPKYSMSAYFLFTNDRRAALLAEKKGIAEVSKITSEEWKNMTEEQKMPYEEMAKKNREKYAEEMEAYKQKKEEESVNLMKEEEEHMKLKKHEALQLLKKEKTENMIKKEME